MQGRIVNKSGAWYAYNGDKIGQGRENAKLFLKEHTDICDEIEKKVVFIIIFFLMRRQQKEGTELKQRIYHDAETCSDDLEHMDRTERDMGQTASRPDLGAGCHIESYG